MIISHREVVNKKLGIDLFDDAPKLYKFLKRRAREMTKAPTLAEMRLSNMLDSMCIQYDFQKVIPPYIADFVFKRQKLIIEVDGDHHDADINQLSHDSKRDEFLNNLGFMVLRFNNKDILENPTPVLNHIINYRITHSKKFAKNKVRDNEYRYLSNRTSRKVFYYYFRKELRRELKKIWDWKFERGPFPYREVSNA